MQPLMKPRRQEQVGCDDVDRLEAGEPGQQVEIRDEQPVGIGDPVSDRDDKASYGVASRFGHQPVAQRMLVGGARRSQPPLVAAKGLGEQARLGERSRRAAIVLGIVRERLLDLLLEAAHRAPVAAELVVEVDDRGNQARSQPAERRARPGAGRI
ncbi:MAG TPA: hypothetical protein VJK49_04290, partial [Candidatus Limnocylindrales bacterium]|nr:hypothetical protein [Candidatus Limnocylindrales bacterium]